MDGRDQLGKRGVRHADDRVRGAVVHRHTIPGAIDQRGRGEDDVRNVADPLVRRLGGEQVVRPSRDDVPGLVEVEERRAHGPFVRLDRGRAGADLRRLPRPRHRAEDVPVTAPVDEIGVSE